MTEKNRFSATKRVSDMIGLQHPEDVTTDKRTKSLQNLFIELCPKTHNRSNGETRGTYSGTLARADKHCATCPFFGGVAFQKKTKTPLAVVCLHPVYRPIKRLEV